MHEPISAIAKEPRSILKITDHREGQASITRQVLPQAERCCHQTLIPFPDFLELRVHRPVAIDACRQTFDTMDVNVQMDETSRSEIGEERFLGACEKSRKLREGDRLAPASEVKSGTPAANDVSEAATRGVARRQADLTAAGHLGWVKRGDVGFHADLRCSVNSFNRRIGFLLLRKPVGLTAKQDCLFWNYRPRGNRRPVKPDD